MTEVGNAIISHGTAIRMAIDAEIRALRHGAISLRLHATDHPESRDMLVMADTLDGLRQRLERTQSAKR